MTFINETVLRLIARFQTSEEGASMAEYGLLLALIAVIPVGGAGTLGEGINGTFEDIADNF